MTQPPSSHQRPGSANHTRRPRSRGRSTIGVNPLDVTAPSAEATASAEATPAAAPAAPRMPTLPLPTGPAPEVMAAWMSGSREIMAAFLNLQQTTLRANAAILQAMFRGQRGFFGAFRPPRS